MNRFGILFSAAVVVLLSSTQALAANGEIKLRQGALCARSDAPGEIASETHHCYFATRKFGKNDFSVGNHRAQYAFTKLGDTCDEIEILADQPYEAPDGGEPLRRMSLACTE